MPDMLKQLYLRSRTREALFAAAIPLLIFGLSACAPAGQSLSGEASGSAASRNADAGGGGPIRGRLPDGCDSDNTFRCARRAELGMTVQLAPFEKERYSGVWKRNYVKVEPERAGILEVAIDPMPPGMQAGVKVYNARQEAIGNTQTHEEGKSLYYEVPVRSGTYYVGARALGDSARYDLRVSLDTEDIYEVNDGFSEAKEIAVGETAKAKIKPQGDEDLYQIEVEEAGPARVFIDEVPANVAMGVAVYDERQKRISIERAAGRDEGQGLAHSFEAPVPGTYYVRASGSGRSDDFYELTVRSSASE